MKHCRVYCPYCRDWHWVAPPAVMNVAAIVMLTVFLAIVAYFVACMWVVYP